MEFTELGTRLILLITSIAVLYFFSNRKDNQTINPLIVIVGLCTFSLCYIFTKIEIGVGIGFGLFAIFSILRFRAQVFTINAIIFLFATITLSILDMLCPFEQIQILLFFQIIIVGFFILAAFIINRKTNSFSNSIDLILPLTDSFSIENESIRKVIKDKIKSDAFDFKIVSINAVLNQVELKVFFNKSSNN